MTQRSTELSAAAFQTTTLNAGVLSGIHAGDNAGYSNQRGSSRNAPVEENDFWAGSISTPWFTLGNHARVGDLSAPQEDMMARKNHAVDRHLGARVRFARIEKRISQGALGEQLGISFQQVQKYELGKDRISASQLMNIARILEKDISFFFEDITPEGETSGGIELADIVDRRKRSRASATYDVKIIRILHAIDDERVKLKLYNLMEAIVAAKAPAEVEAPAAPPAPAPAALVQ